METLKCIQTRRSIRQYKNQTVSDKDLKIILTAGMYAPSAMNKRPWEFVIVQDKKLLEKITQIHPYANFVTEAGTVILACLNTEDAYNNYGPVDVALAAQNIMLAAHDLGYGTCFCGVWPEKERVKDFEKLFDLPKTIEVIGIISLGTPQKQPATPERFDAGKIHFDRW